MCCSTIVAHIHWSSTDVTSASEVLSACFFSRAHLSQACSLWKSQRYTVVAGKDDSRAALLFYRWHPSSWWCFHTWSSAVAAMTPDEPIEWFRQNHPLTHTLWLPHCSFDKGGSGVGGSSFHCSIFFWAFSRSRTESCIARFDLLTWFVMSSRSG